MKKLRHILPAIAALCFAGVAEAMPIGLRTALWNRTARAEQTYTLGEALGADAHSAFLPWTDGAEGEAEAKGHDDATAAGGKSVRFTAADDSSAWVETVVTNACRVSFGWKSSCEPLVKGRPYDYLAFYVDGSRQALVCGETDWTNLTFRVEGEGEHTLRWTFQRDEDGSSGQDCAWLANVAVVSSAALSFSGGGATEGAVPEPVTVYADEQFVLPQLGSLAWPKHTFLGWSDGEALYQPGAFYPVGGVALMTAQWRRNELSAPVIAAPEAYEADSATVTITAEDGAAVYYTLDGSLPSVGGAGSRLYCGPFEVVGSATIRAVAVRDDYFDSEVASATVTRLPWTFGECLNCPTRTFTTGGDAGWFRVTGASTDGYALRSGAITHSQTSRLETVVSGPGTVSFSCKVSGEIVKRTVYDGLAFCIDGVQQGDELFGNAEWTVRTFEVTGAGSHTLSWLYIKDEDGTVGEDCAWLDAVVWTPSGAEAGLEAWLAERSLAADAVAANGRTAEDCYALGLDPTDATNDFRIVSFDIVDGVPHVEWEPKTNRWTGAELRTVLKGAAELGNANWQKVTDENRSSFRFFRVEIDQP